MSREPSILEVCLRRGGMVAGMRLATFIVTWAICARDLGREPSMSEYADWWAKGQSRRTSWRYRAEWKRHFPELASPQPLAAQLLDAVDERLNEARGVAVLGQLPAPSAVVAA